MAKFAKRSGPAAYMLSAFSLRARNALSNEGGQAFVVSLSEGIIMGGQRQSSSIRQQREMSRKLKAAEKRAKRQNRTTEKPKGETEGPKDH
jgi:hypothetical protein